MANTPSLTREFAGKLMLAAIQAGTLKLQGPSSVDPQRIATLAKADAHYLLTLFQALTDDSPAGSDS